MFRNIVKSFACLVIGAIVIAPTLAEAQLTHLPRGCRVDIGDITTGPPDPGAEGPFDVIRADYNFGDSAANLPDFPDPVELRAEVTYPEQLECGPFPIVFIMHGQHHTCLSKGGGRFFDWPCPVVEKPEDFCGPVSPEFCDPNDPLLPNYRGYRYLTDRLASNGIVAVSISANGINFADAGNLEARAQLFRRHFGLWSEFSTVINASFGSLFVGRIDLKRVGIIGHSRGGGAAAFLVDLIAEQDDPFGTIAAPGAGVDIKGVLLVAPVLADDDQTHQVTDTALGVLLPYCDGDQQDLPGVKYYDASRYALVGDNGPKHSFEVIGANHNAYNILWDPNETAINAVDDSVAGIARPFCDPLDDEPFSGRLTSQEQRGTLIAIANAFFRTYLRKEKAFRPFLRGAALPPPSAMTDEIFIGYHPKDAPESRLDVNRLTVPEELMTNTLGGPVSGSGLVTFDFCDPLDGVSANGCLADIGELPITGQAPHAFSFSPVTQLRIAWDSGGLVLELPAFVNFLPEGFRDVSGYQAFQFRAFVDMADPLNPLDQPQNLRVVLRDGAGLSASVIIGDHSPALFFPPPGEPFESSPTSLPRAVLNTVRVPLSAFPDVFLTDIRRVDLIFDQTPSGAINITDLAFADEAANKLPQVACELAEAQLMAGGDKLINVGLSVVVTDDNDGGLAPQISVFSDEDDLDDDNNQSSPDAKDFAPGTLRLRAERDKGGNGRVYLVLSKATDADGELGHDCCTATVPAGNKQKDIASANAQATDALDMCTSFAAASEGLKSIPFGYFEVGDGPVIGPNQ